MNKVAAILLLAVFVIASCGPKPECKTKAGKKKMKMIQNSWKHSGY